MVGKLLCNNVLLLCLIKLFIFGESISVKVEILFGQINQT